MPIGINYKKIYQKKTPQTNPKTNLPMERLPWNWKWRSWHCWGPSVLRLQKAPSLVGKKIGWRVPWNLRCLGNTKKYHWHTHILWHDICMTCLNTNKKHHFCWPLPQYKREKTFHTPENLGAPLNEKTTYQHRSHEVFEPTKPNVDGWNRAITHQLRDR